MNSLNIEVISGVFARLMQFDESIRLFINALCYMFGAIFALFSLFDLHRQHGKPNPGRISNNAWAWGIGVSIVLFALPETLFTMSTAFFNAPEQSPLLYSQVPAGGTPVLAPLGWALRWFGVFFAIKGLFVLRRHGVYGSNEGSGLWKGLVIIGSGIMLVNLKQFLGLVNSITNLNVGAGLF